MTRRAIEAVEATRKLQVRSGHKSKDGKDMFIWAAVSQPPEVRRRARAGEARQARGAAASPSGLSKGRCDDRRHKGRWLRHAADH